MPIVDNIEDVNFQFSKILGYSELYNHTYGLDIEFHNCCVNGVMKQPICTLQVAYNNTPEDVVIVFFKLDPMDFSCTLKDILIANPHNMMFQFLSSLRHIKVGVNITNDNSKIFNDFGIVVQGSVDIQFIARTLGVCNVSMDELGIKYVPNYTLKPKIRGGYLELTTESINYIIGDAIRSREIYQHIISNSHTSIVSNNNKIKITITDDCILFAESFFANIKRITLEKFANHMNYGYSIWYKYLTKEESMKLSIELIDILLTRGSIVRENRYYSKKTS